MRKIPLILLVLVGWPLAAQRFNGHFNTAAYTWENQFPDSSSGKTTKLYQTAMLNAYGVGHSELSWHTYFRASNELGEAAGDRTDYRIYNLYAQWSHPTEKKNFWDVRAGRQFIYGPMRTVTIDGLRTEYRDAAGYSVMGYFGALPPDDGHLSVLKPYQRRSMGAKVQTSRWYQTSVSVSYFEKMREGPFYQTPDRLGLDSNVFRPDMKERFGSLDLRRTFGPVTAYSQTVYNFLTSEVQKFTADGEYQHRDWSAGIQYTYRRPDVLYNSIFSAFDDLHANQEVWLRGQYHFCDWTVHGDYANVFYELKDAWRYQLGVTWRRSDVTFYRRLGYGGTMTGIGASSYYPVMDNLRLQGGISWWRYKLASDITSGDVVDYVSKQVLSNVNTSTTMTCRVTYNWGQIMDIDAETQFLSQSLKSSPVFGGYDYDLRLLLRASYWFDSKFKGR